MKIIDQQVHAFFETPTDFEGCLRLIERAARTCYGSKPSEDLESTKRFVEGLIKRGHLSVLRHSNLVVADVGLDVEPSRYINKHRYLMGGNWQAWLESKYPCTELTQSNIMDFLKKLYKDRGSSSPPELKRYTCHLTTSLRNSHQLVRHTALAFSQKSTRYISHSDLEVIKPWWFSNPDRATEYGWAQRRKNNELSYKQALSSGLSKEDAADELPKATATEMWVTGDRDAWLNLKAQRLNNSTGKAAQQMQDLMRLFDWSIID